MSDFVNTFGGVLTSGLLGAGTSVLSNILGNRVADQAAKRNFNYAVRMWNMQNEYNTPKNQIARLKEAGLNPALMYNNAASGGTASSMSAPQVQYNSPLSGALDKIGSIMSLMQQKIAIDKDKSDIDKNNADKNKTNAETDAIRQAYDFNNAANPLRLKSLGVELATKIAQRDNSELAYKFAKDTFSDRVSSLRLGNSFVSSKIALLNTEEKLNLSKIVLTLAQADQASSAADLNRSNQWLNQFKAKNLQAATKLLGSQMKYTDALEVAQTLKNQAEIYMRTHGPGLLDDGSGVDFNKVVNLKYSPYEKRMNNSYFGYGSRYDMRQKKRATEILDNDAEFAGINTFFKNIGHVLPF